MVSDVGIYELYCEPWTNLSVFVVIRCKIWLFQVQVKIA
jgi:hypothetical protein